MKYLFKTMICLFFTMFTTETYAQGLPGSAQDEEGEKYLKAGEIDKAIGSFKAAVNLGFYHSYATLTNIYKDEIGDYSKALEYQNKYIAAFIKDQKGTFSHDDSLFISIMYIQNGDLYLTEGEMHGLEMDVAKVVMYYEKALEWNAAQRDEIYDLGVKFEMGAFGLPKDAKRAIHLFRRAYEYGRKETAYDLGLCYKYGWGVEEDDQTAIKWFMTVLQSVRDHAGALRELGDSYYYGLGVDKNYSKAFQYLSKAAEKDDEQAMRYLAHYYEDQAKDQKKAFYWMHKAAEKGLASAQNDLGWYYEMGKGVEEDEATAIKWYERAAAQGNKEAAERLKELEEENKKYGTDDDDDE